MSSPKARRASVETLSFYVVYENPSDFPGKFVVRAHHVGRDETWIDEKPTRVSPDRESAYDLLRAYGLVRFSPDPQDDPVIESVWL